MRSVSAALASLFVLVPAFAACDSDSDAKDELTADFCQSDFTATVRAGPDQGVAYAGTLTTTLDATKTKLGGALVLDGSDDADGLQVDGDIVGDQLTLRIHLADGRTITGSGAFGADAKACQLGTQLAGAFVGPDPADTGDWIGPIAAILIGEGIKLLEPYACFAACSYGGSSDAYCNGVCK